MNASLCLLIQDLSLFSFSERSSLKEIFSNLILNCRLGSLNISHLIAVVFFFSIGYTIQRNSEFEITYAEYLKEERISFVNQSL